MVTNRSGKGLAVVVCAAAGFLYALPAQGQVVLGQVDDFQDGTVENWNGAAGFFSNDDGGPAGAGDLFLRVTSSGQKFGPGSRVASFNETQWAGDYLSAGITAIQADMANFGPTDLNMRVLLLFGGGGDFASTDGVIVPADGVWRTYTLGLTAADLTFVPFSGTGVLNDTLNSVGRLLIRHGDSPDGIGGGTPILGDIGMDNITAIPEPGAALLMLLGAVAVRRARASR
jgi:hypothetical protein